MPAKGSGQFGPDLLPGTAEYAKAWRAKNKDRQKLAQSKYLQKQRQLALAARIAIDDKIPIEQALQEVFVGLKDISTLRSKLQNEGKITSTSDELVFDEGEKRISFIDDEAKRRNKVYKQTLRIMQDFDTPDWEVEFAKVIEEYDPISSGGGE